jgi:hypothetical protein
MRSFLEKILPQSLVDSYREYRNIHIAGKTRERWERAGKPVPPPHIIKQQAIRYYQKKSGYTILVETGTYKGDMVLAQKDSFEKIISIELSRELYEKAKQRFRRYEHITILQGNSGEVIGGVLSELKEPAIFWLDGHYSGGITAKIDKYSPIREELRQIFARNSLQHIILIDDARGFTGEHGYPEIEELRDLVHHNLRGYQFSIEEDIIRLVPEKFM